jgi:hypothetical protein
LLVEYMKQKHVIFYFIGLFTVIMKWLSLIILNIS